MKKIKTILLIIALIILTNNVKIKAFSINSVSAVYVNTDVAVTVNATGLTGRFSISSSNNSVLSGDKTVWLENKEETFYFTAKSVGTATITVTAVEVSDNNAQEFTGSRSIMISVKNKPTNSNTTIDVNKNYSKNNYLNSLSVDGYTLNPIFNKETLEYNITLDPGTEKINIKASTEDRKSGIKGNGEVNLSEGVNILNVVVTAENGNEKTYVIKASVEEKDPIIVKVDGKKYRVVKKQNLIPSIDGYSITTVLINKFDIPALYNEVTKVTLVGLKDEDGNISLFSYDSSTGEYREYKEFTFDRMNLYVHKDNKSKYKEIKIKINDKEVIAYELDGAKDYYLLYATNTITGNESYYLYDIKENSVQRYDTLMLESLTHEKDKYLSVVLVLSSVCFLSMLFLLIEVNRDNKRKFEES